MQIVKRDGRVEYFNSDKIINAVNKAFVAVDGHLSPTNARKSKAIAKYVETLDQQLTVEEIQDIVEDQLMASNRKDVARAYIRYRYKKELVRVANTTDQTIFELIEGTSEYWNNENANKNAMVVTTQRDYLAGITSTDITRRFLLPKEVLKAHDDGIIHFHDADYFAQRALTNCELVNLEDMLQNGTVVNNVMIEKPHRFITAATIATQIILAVTSSTYGGCTVTLTHLAPFVRDSYNRFHRIYKERGLSDEQAKEFATKDTRKEVADGVQTFNYQVNSMTNTNGQAPFLSVCMYLNETDEYKDELAMIIEEFLSQRILGFKNEKGVYITPAFPKLLYVLEEDNINPEGKYFYLTQLAAKCTAKRMVPDYISEKIMKQFKIDANGNGNCYPCMGCRSFLTPYVDENGKPKYYGRFNQGVVSINLMDLALSSEGDFDRFWQLFEDRTELCHTALQARHNRLKGLKAEAAPILWKYGAMARLKADETIDKLLMNGYSTISLGYAGLYECVKYMTGHSHTDGAEGEQFGLQVMEALNAKTKAWKEAEHIDYSLYGTPIESTTYKFATNLKRRFGDDVFVKLDGFDRDYITNSYHVPVFEEIDPFEKLALESKFQKLSPGGAISYIECADLTQNTDAVIEVVNFIYNNIMYAELNTKSDYCHVCGYDGEIKIVDLNGKLDWQCPNCGNTDHNKMNVARRTCGYIGTNFFNQGRTNEIKDRYVHLDDHQIIGK